MLTESPFPTTAELADFQAAAEAGMLDACTITRPGDTDSTYDTPTTVYTGKCRVRAAGRVASDSQGPSAAPTDRHRDRVDIPVSVTGVRFNDRIDITASINPSLVGAFGMVADTFTQSFASAQRLPCELTFR